MKSPSWPISNSRGEIVTAIVAAVVVALAVVGSLYLFKNYQRTRQTSVQLESGGDVANKKLEELLSLPWISADLTSGEHLDPAPDSPLRWVITDVTARLKKIEVISKHQHRVSRQIAERGVAVSGYRYYDF